jgi:Zn-dependent protease with chaperone function
MNPDELMHSHDLAALEQLRAVPFLDQFLKKMMELSVEQFLHGKFMANHIRLGPEQLPEIYQLLPPICQKFEITEPEFYLAQDPTINAYTMGDTRTFLIIHSGLVENFSHSELQAVLAHECGHIVCRHVLYHTLMDFLTTLGGAFFGIGEVMTGPVRLALAHWSRASEFSADRAAAVFTDGADPIIRALVRLAGGTKRIAESMNIESFLLQGEYYESLKESKWDKLLQSLALMSEDHPFLAVRARELQKWTTTYDFKHLIEDIQVRHSDVKCLKCGHGLSSQWKFCQQCGTSISERTPG